MTTAIPQTTASHAIGETTPALLRGTISANLDATIARFGDREALIDRAQGIRWTYAAFGAEVDRLARALMAVGLAKGDRIGIWAPNCAEWTVTQYATAKLGASSSTSTPRIALMNSVMCCGRPEFACSSSRRVSRRATMSR